MILIKRILIKQVELLWTDEKKKLFKTRNYPNLSSYAISGKIKKINEKKKKILTISRSKISKLGFFSEKSVWVKLKVLVLTSWKTIG